MIVLVIVNALEAPRSAVGAATRVTVQSWEGPGSETMETELRAILSAGAVGVPLRRGVVAWPPPAPVHVVPGDGQPEVLIDGSVELLSDTLTPGEGACFTREVQLAVTAEALRVAGASISDRLSWSLSLRDTACGAAPLDSAALVEEAMRDLAPEVAALVLPRWTASEVALLRTAPCAVGVDRATAGDWESAGRRWESAEADPACVFNLGVKAELEGRIPLALQYYDEAARRGVIPAASAADRAEARGLELERLGQAPAALPSPAAAAAEGQITAAPVIIPPENPNPLRWRPPSGAFLSASLGRTPDRVGELTLATPTPIPGLTWEGQDGAGRGGSVEFGLRPSLASDNLRPELLLGGAFFPGVPTEESVIPLSLADDVIRITKLERILWATACPYIGAWSLGRYHLIFSYGLGVGAVRKQPYRIEFGEETTIEAGAGQPRVGVATSIGLRIQLDGSRWSVGASRVGVLSVDPPGKYSAASLGLSYAL